MKHRSIANKQDINESILLFVRIYISFHIPQMQFLLYICTKKTKFLFSLKSIQESLIPFGKSLTMEVNGKALLVLGCVLVHDEKVVSKVGEWNVKEEDEKDEESVDYCGEQ